MNHTVIHKFASFSEIIHIVYKHIQDSRYERMIIKLAEAYEGYQFYLPAFLDFRGRIYRSDVLHFHEHDLARSLIMFAGPSKDLDMNTYRHICVGTAFLYKSFVSENNALNWFLNLKNNLSCKKNPDDYLFNKAYEAKRPFQFLAYMLGHDGINNRNDLRNDIYYKNIPYYTRRLSECISDHELLFVG